MTQLAFAFAGFSGIVAAFNRQPDRWRVAGRVRARGSIDTSLAATFFALLPRGLDVTQLAKRSIWRTSSVVLGLSCAASAMLAAWRVARLVLEDRAQFPKVALTLVPGGSFINAAAQLTNAAACGHTSRRGLSTYSAYSCIE